MENPVHKIQVILKLTEITDEKLFHKIQVLLKLTEITDGKTRP